MRRDNSHKQVIRLCHYCMQATRTLKYRRNLVRPAGPLSHAATKRMALRLNNSRYPQSYDSETPQTIPYCDIFLTHKAALSWFRVVLTRAARWYLDFSDHDLVSESAYYLKPCCYPWVQCYPAVHGKLKLHQSAWPSSTTLVICYCLLLAI